MSSKTLMLTVSSVISIFLIGASRAADIEPASRALQDALLTVTPHAQVLSPGSVPAGDVGSLGRGFSNLGSDWRGKCVDYVAGSDQPKSKSVTTNFEIQLVNTADEFLTVMGMSASASMSIGIFSGNASATALKRVTSNAYSNFIIGKVTVTTEPTVLNTTGLSKLGKQALAAGQNSFHASCGTEFAASAVYGGEFAFLLEVSSKDDNEFQSVHKELSASVGTFGSASGSFSESMQKISNRYQLKASVIRAGLNEPLPDPTAKAYEDYALKFPEKVTANDGVGMRVIRYGLLPYPAVDATTKSFSSQESYIAKAAQLYLTALRQAGEIDYYFVNPDLFLSGPKPEVLRSTGAELSRALETLGDTVVNCSEQPSVKCRGPLPSVVTSGVPSRLAWVKLRLKDGGHVVVGTVPPGETRRLRLRGIWSPSGGVDWWVPAENGSFKFQIISKKGEIRGPFPTPSMEVAYAGDRVEVWLEDNPYSDNVESSTDPASATLY